MHNFETILLFKDALYGSLLIAVACSGFAVAGITQVTAGCETMNFRKSCAHDDANGAAHSGRRLPRVDESSDPV